MSCHVSADTAAEAWTQAIHVLLEAPAQELVNLSVAIRNPLPGCDLITDELESFLAAERSRKPATKVESVTTVANTIFPAALYQPGRSDAEARLYAARRRITKRRKRFRPREESYFDRMIAYPSHPNPINQLERVLRQLRQARERGHRNGSLYELALFEAKRDARPQGFPCLSHISLTLMDATVSLTALYRNHYFLRRAYGNYIGLARLLGFVANEAGFGVGELLCVSSHATLDCGIGEVRRLHATCVSHLNSQATA